MGKDILAWTIVITFCSVVLTYVGIIFYTDPLGLGLALGMIGFVFALIWALSHLGVTKE